VATRIEVEFDDGWKIEGQGHVEVEDSHFFGARELVLQKGNLCYLRVDEAHLRKGEQTTQIAPGEYVICRGGLYKRVI